jgi:hypothetical protein
MRQNRRSARRPCRTGSPAFARERGQTALRGLVPDLSRRAIRGRPTTGLDDWTLEVKLDEPLASRSPMDRGACLALLEADADGAPELRAADSFVRLAGLSLDHLPGTR